MLVIGWASMAVAGPEHVDRVHARHEAAELELLQRSTTRSGVQEQAVARYLDRWSGLDTRPVREVEAWGEALRAAPPDEVPPGPDRPLAIPVPSSSGSARNP